MEYIEDGFGLWRNLELYRFELTLQALDESKLLPYNGSTFKGEFGHRLKESVCLKPDISDCRNKPCLLSSCCLYHQLFVSPTPPNTQFQAGSRNISPPLVIEPPLTNQLECDKNGYALLPEGGSIKAGLVLTGWLVGELPLFIHIFQKMGAHGVGWENKKSGTGHFELTQVRDTVSGKIIFSHRNQDLLENDFSHFGWNEAVAKTRNEGQVEICIHTPISIMERIDYKKRRPLKSFTGFGQLFYHLYWRLLTLSYFHSSPFGLHDQHYQDLTARANRDRDELMERAARDVHLEETRPTTWHWYRRHSNYSDHKELQGFTGRYRLTGNLTPYLPCSTRESIRICAAKPGGNGGPVYLAGGKVRAGKSDDHQQFAFFQVGSHL